LFMTSDWKLPNSSVILLAPSWKAFLSYSVSIGYLSRRTAKVRIRYRKVGRSVESCTARYLQWTAKMGQLMELSPPVTGGPLAQRRLYEGFLLAPLLESRSP
jgi:hypothetical protein